MTQNEFTAFYPQFAGFTPAFVLSAFVDRANGLFTGFPGADAEEARRLYVAHQLTLYARTAPPDGAANKAALAEAGGTQRVASKKAGEVSVAYAAGASSAISVSSGRADLAETVFGLRLLSLLRLCSRGRYIP